jgi:hypothetical protein
VLYAAIVMFRAALAGRKDEKIDAIGVPVVGAS